MLINRIILVLIFLFIILLPVIAEDNKTQGSTTIIIVRHAEKVSEEFDSPLAPAGKDRAKKLAEALKNCDLNAIYSTQFQRNKDTAAIIATEKKINITIQEVNIKEPGNHSQILASEILKNHSGKNVLVIGHSNTIGSLINEFFKNTEAEENTNKQNINKIEYSDMFIVTISPNGKASLIKTQYGISIQN